VALEAAVTQRLERLEIGIAGRACCGAPFDALAEDV
jgi:hypothetical protein